MPVIDETTPPWGNLTCSTSTAIYSLSVPDSTGVIRPIQDTYQKRHAPPTVVPTPPLTIDQQCAAAQSRLRVSLDANAEWQKSILHKQCAEYDMAECARNAQLDTVMVASLNYWLGSQKYDITWVNKVFTPPPDYLWLICWGILAAVFGTLLALL